MDLKKVKRAVSQAGAELTGAARDLDWQSLDVDLEEIDQKRLAELGQELRTAAHLVSKAIVDIVKLEREIQARPEVVVVKKRRLGKYPWRVTS